MHPLRGGHSDPSPTDEGMPIGTGMLPATTDAARQKPSLRILNEGLATREEDLLHGPLLRGIGSGVYAGFAEHEYETAYSSALIVAELNCDDSHEPGTIDRESTVSSPPLSLRPNVSLPAVPQSEPSDAGGTFSLPTESTASTYPETVDDARERHLTSHDRASFLWLSSYEFERKDSCLLFANEPFLVDRAAAKRSSRDSLALGIQSTVPPESDIWPQSHLMRDLETDQARLDCLFGIGAAANLPLDFDLDFAPNSASSVSSWPDESAGGVDQNIEALDSICGIHETIEWLLMYLDDDYTRSCAPQRPGTKNIASSNRSVPYATDGTGSAPKTNNIPTRQAPGRRGRGIVDGNGESEDEDAQHNRCRYPDAINSKKLLCFACPFLRWDPIWFQRCRPKLQTISHLKQHIRRSHYDTGYCGECYRVFGKSQGREHLCIPLPSAPAGFITRSKLEQLKIYADRTQSPAEQWKHIYTLLFPGEPVSQRPFLTDAMSKAVKKRDEYIHSEKVQKFIRKELESAGCSGKILDAACKNVTEKLMPRLLLDLQSILSAGAEDRSPSRERGEAASLVDHCQALTSASDINTEMARRADQTITPASQHQDWASAFDSYTELVNGNDETDSPFCYEQNLAALTRPHTLQYMGNESLHRYSESTADAVYPTLELKQQPGSRNGGLDNQPRLEGFEDWYAEDVTDIGDVAASDLEASTWDASTEQLGHPPDTKNTNAATFAVFTEQGGAKSAIASGFDAILNTSTEMPFIYPKISGA